MTHLKRFASTCEKTYTVLTTTIDKSSLKITKPEDEELDVSHEPFQKVAIMECTKFPTPDDLARFANIAAGGKPTGVYWAEGVAFIYFPVPSTTETATKALLEEKKVYWAFVSYALMPSYHPLIETKEKIIVPVINMAASPLFQKVAQWLKDHEVKTT